MCDANKRTGNAGGECSLIILFKQVASPFDQKHRHQFMVRQVIPSQMLPVTVFLSDNMPLAFALQACMVWRFPADGLRAVLHHAGRR